MNAGGVDKACKSNGSLPARVKSSGERVSNAWVTTPKDETNPSKGGLMLDGPRIFARKSGVKGTRKRTAFGSACVLSASW